MNILFSQLSDKLPYPTNIRAQLSTYHADIVSYAMHNPAELTTSYKQHIVNTMNTISYLLLARNNIPDTWKSSEPFTGLELFDDFEMEQAIQPKQLYLTVRTINWDIPGDSPVPASVKTSEKLEEVQPKKEKLEDVKATKTYNNFKSKKEQVVATTPELTPKEHLYIKPPQVPTFKTDEVYIRQVIDNNVYTVYPTLPIIPTNQSEISITTDVNMMTPKHVLNLYPNWTVRTRADIMYQPYGDLKLDDDVGIILPIAGFTRKQVKDNIIKYPHLYKILREVDDELVSFYKHIEVNGKLHDILTIWEELEDSERMPKNAEYIKEYVVRRYLLERDILHVNHKYPIWGTFEPFLTLYTTPDNYAKLGYKDAEVLARSCVVSRVHYKYSRNPIIRRCNNG